MAEPTAGTTDSPSAAPVSQPAQAPAASPSTTGGAAGGGGDAYMSVPKDGFKPFGGDWHEASRLGQIALHAQEDGTFELAQAIKRDFGMTPQEYYQALREAATDQPATPEGQGAQPVAEDPDAKPLTVAEFKRIQQEQQKAESDARKKAQEEQSRTAAQFARKNLTDAVMGELKMGPDKPGHNFIAPIIPGILDSVIAEELRQHPDLMYWKPEDIRHAASGLQPTEAQVATAKERAVAMYKDWVTATVSAYAAGQIGLPDATVGAGTGTGGEAGVDPETMSFHDFMALPNQR